MGGRAPRQAARSLVSRSLNGSQLWLPYSSGSLRRRSPASSTLPADGRGSPCVSHHRSHRCFSLAQDSGLAPRVWRSDLTEAPSKGAKFRINYNPVAKHMPCRIGIVNSDPLYRPIRCRFRGNGSTRWRGHGLICQKLTALGSAHRNFPQDQRSSAHRTNAPNWRLRGRQDSSSLALQPSLQSSWRVLIHYISLRRWAPVIVSEESRGPGDQF